MDYDNTNRGAAHAPFESQNLLLTGKLDKDGTNKQVAIIQDKDQQGRDVLVVFERVGVMYGNEDATDDNKQPHYSGPIDDNHRMSWWSQLVIISCIFRLPYITPTSVLQASRPCWSLSCMMATCC